MRLNKHFNIGKYVWDRFKIDVGMWNSTQKITCYEGYVENFNFNQEGLG